MEEIIISNFNEFNDIVQSHNTTNYLFRGQANIEWSLIPKIGRPDFYKTLSRTIKEEDIINSWRLNFDPINVSVITNGGLLSENTILNTSASLIRWLVTRIFRSSILSSNGPSFCMQ